MTIFILFHNQNIFVWYLTLIHIFHGWTLFTWNLLNDKWDNLNLEIYWYCFPHKFVLPSLSHFEKFILGWSLPCFTGVLNRETRMWLVQTWFKITRIVQDKESLSWSLHLHSRANENALCDGVLVNTKNGYIVTHFMIWVQAQLTFHGTLFKASAGGCTNFMRTHNIVLCMYTLK